jgi:hypothetical protein
MAMQNLALSALQIVNPRQMAAWRDQCTDKENYWAGTSRAN